MPAADTTPERSFFLMHESQLRLWGPAPAWAGTYFLTYGVGSNTELAVTLFDIGVDRNGALYGNAALAAGFKSVIPFLRDSAPSLEFGLITGGMGLASLRNGSFGGWMYAIPTIRLPVLRTRLSAGVSFATEQLYGAGRNEFSFAASLEQPIPIPGTRGFSLVAEWFSGSHDLSNLIVGATWHLHPALLLVLGWKIPTQDQFFHINEQALVFEVGVFFPRIGRGPAYDDHDDHGDHGDHGGGHTREGQANDAEARNAHDNHGPASSGRAPSQRGPTAQTPGDQQALPPHPPEAQAQDEQRATHP